MKKRLFFLFNITLVLVLCSAFFVPQPAGQGKLLPMMPIKYGGTPSRIVSMAPAITEILFAIGAGKTVKGVTDYCFFPKAAKKIKKVGGFYNPNFEAILGIRPDLVILLPAHREQRLQFQKLRIPTYTVDLNTITGIVSSIMMLGLICEKEIQAAAIVRQFTDLYKSLKLQDVARKKVMLVINRDRGSSQLRDIYIAGKGEFYDELITLAGAENVYKKKSPKYPKLSAESMMVLDPDMIIELIPDAGKNKRSIRELQEDWGQVPGLKAYKNNNIHLLTGDHLVVPGPRLIKLYEELKRCLDNKQ